MKYFSLYPSSQITLGAKKACLIDLEESKYCELPLIYGKIFFKEDTIEIEKMKVKFSKEEYSFLDEFLQFLQKNNFGEFLEKKINFKNLNHLNYNVPFQVITSIIDFKKYNDCEKVISRINVIPKSTQIRLFFDSNIDELSTLISMLIRKGFMNVELILNFNKTLQYQELIDLIKNNSIIFRIILGNCEEDKFLNPSFNILTLCL
jgi:hypothetical protein